MVSVSLSLTGKSKEEGDTKTAESEEWRKALDTWALRMNRMGLISNQADGL